MSFQNSKILLTTILFSAVYLTKVAGMDLFNVNYVETSDSRLIATSNYNYAIYSTRLLSKNWKAVSVNGENISILTSTGGTQAMTKAQLSDIDRSFIESLRDELARGGNGFNQFSSSSGGGGSYMISSSNGGGVSSSYSSSNGAIQSGGMSINMRDENNFSVSKSDFPFSWSRLFFNNDLLTIVFRSGDVQIRDLNALEPAEIEFINKLKAEVKGMQRAQAQDFSNTMQHSMDMVSNVFSNIMGSFPRPPNYQSAVGGLFGNNFPFGSNNSPFSSTSGWPFGSGGAFAFAGRR